MVISTVVHPTYSARKCRYLHVRTPICRFRDVEYSLNDYRRLGVILTAVSPLFSGDSFSAFLSAVSFLRLPFSPIMAVSVLESRLIVLVDRSADRELHLLHSPRHYLTHNPSTPIATRSRALLFH